MPNEQIPWDHIGEAFLDKDLYKKPSDEKKSPTLPKRRETPKISSEKLPDQDEIDRRGLDALRSIADKYKKEKK